MKALKASAVAVGGLVSSALTIAGIVAAGHGTGANPFGLFFWGVVPVGAILCGFVAASGYYLAARFLHLPPSKSLLVQMVAVAVATPVIVYWFEYSAASTAQGVPASTIMTFGHFLDGMFTGSQMKVGVSGVIPDSPPLGSLGYFVVLLEIVGFLLGGLGVYWLLSDQPMCDKCARYLRTLAIKRYSFDDDDAFSAYYDHEFDHPVDSPAFAMHVGGRHDSKVKDGSFRLKATVLSCPSCGGQRVSEIVDYWGANGLQGEEGLARTVQFPPGVDVAPAYR